MRTVRFDRAGPLHPAMQLCGLHSRGTKAGTTKAPAGGRSRDSKITRQCEVDSGEKGLWKRDKANQDEQG